MTHKFLDRHLAGLEVLEAHSFILKVDDAQELMSEFELMKRHTVKLEAAILKYCGRPTKNGAKELLAMLENPDEAREKLVQFQMGKGGKWKVKYDGNYLD